MAEGGGDDLRKGGAQRAIALRDAARVNLNISPVKAGNMAELVNNRALLRPDQQQHEPQCLVYLSHEIRAVGAAGAYVKANRIPRSLQYALCNSRAAVALPTGIAYLGRASRRPPRR